MIHVSGFNAVLLGVPRDYFNSVASTAGSILSLLTEQFTTLLTLFLFAGIGMLWNAQHNSIGAAIARVQQCDVLPVLNSVVLPIANFLRLLYDAIWPLVSLGENYRAFITTGWYRVLRQCTIAEVDPFSVIEQLATAAEALADAIVTFFSGDIFADRFLLTDFFTQTGLVANELLPALDCFCEWLNPIWVFATSLPQMQALHSALEAVVNVGIRLAQITLTAITELDAPFWSTAAEEAILLVISLGETAEQAALLALDLLTDLINQIGLLAQSDPVGTRALFGLPPLVDDDDNAVPPTLSDLMHAAANTKLSQSSFAPPRAGVGAAVERRPIWDIPPDSNVTDYLGFPAILLLMQTPWSHIVTELVAGGIVFANMTANIVSNPIEIFETPEAIAYLQFTAVFDRLRASWDALCQLLVIIDPALPDAVSLLGQAAITFGDAIIEMIVGTIVAIIWPTWSFGEPPPTDCSTPGSCGYPAPGDWTIFNIFPDYYDWSNNGLRRTLLLLEADADAVAVLLNCNETTLADDNCTALPFQCAVRTAYLFVVEAVNQTNAFILYLPDLAQFDSSLKTFQDLSPARLQDLLYLFIECLTTWYAFFV
jgi:hypothetical protein